MKILSVLFLSVGLTACASMGKKPYLASDPITVSKTSDYWVSDENKYPFKTQRPSVIKRLRGKDIEVSAKYLIDSNGDVFNVEIIESNVDTSMEGLVIKALEEIEYYPAEGNSNKQPIIAKSKLTFSMGD